MTTKSLAKNTVTIVNIILPYFDHHFFYQSPLDLHILCIYNSDKLIYVQYMQICMQMICKCCVWQVKCYFCICFNLHILIYIFMSSIENWHFLITAFGPVYTQRQRQLCDASSWTALKARSHGAILSECDCVFQWVVWMAMRLFLWCDILWMRLRFSIACNGLCGC